MKLALQKAFRQVGATDEQAHQAAESIDSALDKRIKDSQAHLATKADIHELKIDIATVRSEMATMKAELIRLFVTSQVATIGVILTVVLGAMRYLNRT